MKRQCIPVLAAVFLFPAVFGPAPAATETSEEEALARLSASLLASVPRGKALAVRPFTEAETGLPQDVADQLYDKLLSGLFEASRGRHQLREREELKALFSSAAEFSNTDIKQVLEAARADVDVLCDVTPNLNGVQLSCRATDILEATIVGRAEALVPVQAANVQPFEPALIGLAADIWPYITDMGSIQSEGIRDQQTGSLTNLGTHVADRLMEQFNVRFSEAERKRKRDRDFQEAIAPGESKDSTLRDYRLSGVIWTLDEELIDIRAKVKWQGRVVATRSVRVAMATVPESLRAVAGTRAEFYEAVGEAVVSARLDREAATRAARNLARARVIAQATGVSGPAATEVADEADAATLIQFLSFGIPKNERSSPISTGGDRNRVAVSVKAQVVPVGSAAAPSISASLNKPVYRAMEPIVIEVTSPVTAHLGIFAWGADNNVVRIYPNAAHPEVVVEPDRTVSFPLPGEQITIRSAPMPVAGNREDHEAFIVVASAAPINFRGMAEAAGGTLDETMQFAVPAPQFLSALGKSDLTRTRVQFLPYQVRK